jgi:hypothetical protein
MIDRCFVARRCQVQWNRDAEEVTDRKPPLRKFRVRKGDSRGSLGLPK